MGNPFARAAFAAPASGGAPSAAAMPVGTSGVSVDFTSARSEISDAMAGRVSLAILNSMILALVLFYFWTRRAQGGG